MLDFTDKTLNRSAFPVAPGIIVSRRFGIGRDNHLNASGNEFIDKILCAIAAVGKDGVKVQVNGHLMRLDDVVALPSSQSQTQRIAQAVSSHMNFGTKAATT